jgi:hypothetical protein
MFLKQFTSMVNRIPILNHVKRIFNAGVIFIVSEICIITVITTTYINEYFFFHLKYPVKYLALESHCDSQ